jgi:hypothetical protein
MREQSTAANFSTGGGGQMLEMRRRIADCRERLRRNRAARRIPERANSPTELFAAADAPEGALACAAVREAGEEI